MSFLSNAFNKLLSLKSRTVTLTRPGVTPLVVTIKMTPSAYHRKLETVSDAVIYGNEYIFSKAALDAVSFPRIKRGDRITDADLGTLTVNEVDEMFDIGGKIIGYRTRTG